MSITEDSADKELATAKRPGEKCQVNLDQSTDIPLQNGWQVPRGSIQS